MTVILRHRPSGFYYSGRRCWVDDPERALDLRSLDRATDAAREQSFGGMEIVAGFDEPDCELVLPIQFNRTSRGTATVGPSEEAATLPPSLLFARDTTPPPPNLSAPELV